MTYMHEFVSLTFGGTTAAEEDIWTCGIKLDGAPMASDPHSTYDQVVAKIAALGGLLEDFVSDQYTFMPKGVKLKWCKLALIGTDGKYVKAPAEIQLNAEGFYADNYVPQATFVNTLVSGEWKDPGKYNRFYLPGFIPGGGGAFRLNPTDAQHYADALSVLVTALNAELEDINPSAPVRVNVLTNSGTGNSNPVEQVRIGNVIDTQRRRRNKIVETYYTTPVVL